MAHADTTGPTITVVPWLAPNHNGSLSWPGAAQNAVYAMENDLTSYGSGPSAFNAQYSGTSASTIVTGFPSWDGIADPGGAYANELGNRITFAVAINGNGDQISAADLFFSGSSTDEDGLGYDRSAGYFDYSDALVGVINGVGGPTYVTSGPNTQMVDAIYFAGIGNSYAAYCPSCSTADEQTQIDLTAAGPSYSYTGTYGIGAKTNSATFDVVGTTPEPSSMILLGTGIVGIAGAVRRRGFLAFRNNA